MIRAIPVGGSYFPMSDNLKRGFQSIIFRCNAMRWQCNLLKTKQL